MTLKEIKSKIIESSISSIVGLIVGALLTTLLWLFSDIPSAFISLLPVLPNTTLTKLSTGLLLIVLFEAFWIYSLRKRLKAKLKSSFGMLWDRDANPYCPACQKRLTNYRVDYAESLMIRGAPGFKCLSCDRIVFIEYEPDTYYDLPKVKQIVKSQFAH